MELAAVPLGASVDRRDLETMVDSRGAVTVFDRVAPLTREAEAPVVRLIPDRRDAPVVPDTAVPVRTVDARVVGI